MDKASPRTGHTGTRRQVISADAFKVEAIKWAGVVGVEAKGIHLRPMKTKWASCSSNGRLTFNTELLGCPARFRAETVVHELLHLKVRNHGRLFKELLRTVLSHGQPDLPDMV